MGLVLVLLLEITLLALALLVLLPVAVLCVECLAALLPGRRNARSGASGANGFARPRVAVLIPAHNEELGLPETLRSIQPQLRPGDRVVVVADHCDDDTAAVARAANCEVVERDDAAGALARGKGYALDAGLKHLAADPPDVVVMVDADCRVDAGAVEALASLAAQTGRPVQAAYVMSPAAEVASESVDGAARQKQLVSVLAILLKNHVRPRGLGRLGCPCLLTGSGMAFPWHVIRDAPLASGNIVEDMQLGLDLAMAGHPAVFCEDARITSALPARDEAAARQRRRWEHGHLHTLLRQVPRLLWSGARGRFASLPLALELAVPPLSLLTAALLGSLLLSVLVAATTSVSWTAAAMVACGLASLLACVVVTWWRFGRGALPFSALLAAPWYVIWKAPIYASFFRGREKQWQRTERPSPPAPVAAPPVAPARAPARDPSKEPADVTAGA